MSEHTCPRCLEQCDCDAAVYFGGGTCSHDCATPQVPAEHIAACVHALAGLKPEHVRELVEAARAVVQTLYDTVGDATLPVRCRECYWPRDNHDADCCVGNLAALLAKVKK